LLFLLISLSPVETASFLSHMAVLPFTLINLGVLINDNDGIRRRETRIAYTWGDPKIPGIVTKKLFKLFVKV